MRKRIVLYLAVILIPVLCGWLVFTRFPRSCQADESYLKHPYHQLRSYSFDDTIPLVARVRTAPELVLKMLRKMDGRPDYAVYEPGPDELRMIGKCLDMLPPMHQRILKKRLIQIYFIRNFMGSGLTDWVIDRNNEVYTIMIFNPDVLKQNISDRITLKENTCFIQDDPDIKISIDCGTKYPGFLYIMLHEATHAVDYVTNITPNVEDSSRSIRKNKMLNYDFVKSIWKDYSVPLAEYDFPLRPFITFYGFQKGPKIRATDSVPLYGQLKKTPFVSVYASQNWAEDLAELLTFYHLNVVLHQPYAINVYKKKKLMFSYEPMRSDLVKERFAGLKKFYQ